MSTPKEVSIPAPPKLKGKENFSHWSRMIKICLQGKGLFGYCDGTQELPNTPKYT